MGLFDSLGAFGGQSQQPQGGLLGIDPMNLALLAAGAAGLEAGGPSLKPVSTGQAIGRMVNAGLGAYSSALARIFHDGGRRFRAEARCYWFSRQTTTGIADAKLYR